MRVTQSGLRIDSPAMKPITVFHKMSKEELAELYNEKQLSQRAIAEFCGVSKPTVLYRLKKLGIAPHSHAMTGCKNPHWKGGRQKAARGYICIWLDKDSTYYPMADHRGTVLEHRLVMAQHLGRCLERWEVVHHRNGIRNDNCIENLELFPNQKEHIPSMQLQCELNILRKEVKLLKWRLNELQEEVKLLKSEEVS